MINKCLFPFPLPLSTRSTPSLGNLCPDSRAHQANLLSMVYAVLSCVWFLATPWVLARQAPLSMEFSKQQYWNWLPFPPPGDLTNPGIKPVSPALTDRFFILAPPWKPTFNMKWMKVTQSCPTLYKPIDYIVHGILQARKLQRVAVPFSSRSFQPRDWTQVSHIEGGLLTSWTTQEAQEYWGG